MLVNLSDVTLKSLKEIAVFKVHAQNWFKVRLEYLIAHESITTITVLGQVTQNFRLLPICNVLSQNSSFLQYSSELSHAPWKKGTHLSGWPSSQTSTSYKLMGSTHKPMWLPLHSFLWNSGKEATITFPPPGQMIGEIKSWNFKLVDIYTQACDATQ